MLCDKAFNIAKNPKHDGCQRVLAQMVHTFSDKKTSGSGVKNENMPDQHPLDLNTWQLAKELHKPIISWFEKQKKDLSFKDNIWGDDLADMQLISTFKKGFRFLLCAIDIYCKYVWVVPLRDKKGIKITNTFQKF